MKCVQEQRGDFFMKNTTSHEKCNREDVLKYALKQYGTKPEYPWTTLPDDLVLRHADNRKWYGLIMTVKRENLGLSGTGYIDILDIKCDPEMAGFLVAEKGILPGYHMHKGNWITILLDGSVERKQVCSCWIRVSCSQPAGIHCESRILQRKRMAHPGKSKIL